MKCKECGREDMVCYDLAKLEPARDAVLGVWQKMVDGVDGSEGFDLNGIWEKGKALEMAHKAVMAFLECPILTRGPIN